MRAACLPHSSPIDATAFSVPALAPSMKVCSNFARISVSMTSFMTRISLARSAATASAIVASRSAAESVGGWEGFEVPTSSFLVPLISFLSWLRVKRRTHRGYASVQCSPIGEK